jgi:hypothetical protein
MSWQAIGQMNPGKPIFNPRVIPRENGRWVVETANGEINLAGIRRAPKGQGGSAFLTE